MKRRRSVKTRETVEKKTEVEESQNSPKRQTRHCVETGGKRKAASKTNWNGSGWKAARSNSKKRREFFVFVLLFVLLINAF